MCSQPPWRALPVKPRKFAAAAARLARAAGGSIDVAIVLGSGLAREAGARISGTAIPYDRLRAPNVAVAGHMPVAYAGLWASKRVAAFAGRAHLYAGYDPSDVTYLVRLAAAAGATTIVLTNAAGGLNSAFASGDIMLVTDHINLTGATPLAGDSADPFLDMTDAYSPRLRALARSHGGDENLREGVYAGVRGPHYETAAESEALRRMGADAVGMSTVLETIAARALGCEVLGLSLITNAAGQSGGVSHDNVLAAGRAGAVRLTDLVERIIAAL